MIRKLFILLLVTSFTVSQNFAYNPDDWYVIKNPGQIYSITEGPFNKIYFGTENGIFSYNPLNETLKYDYELNQGLDYDEMIMAIHYDKYSNQIWIATNRGVFYKSPIFTTFNEVSFTVNELYNSLDLYVVSARCEGGPQAIFECAQTRTPIISTKVSQSFFLHKSCIYDYKDVINKENIDNALKSIDHNKMLIKSIKLTSSIKKYYNYFVII